ncbi:hypothetical protein PG996_006917 [Apiospora saccharicola]|uniref:Uncharacterized protein n=1 Tax=Apiospora saccharicola TaxID=335842 RepID=A0ABR1VC34_9PEZI
MLFNLRNAAVAFLVALAAMTSGASPIIQANGTDSLNGTVAVRGHKPWPPPYWGEFAAPTPAAAASPIVQTNGPDSSPNDGTVVAVRGHRPQPLPYWCEINGGWQSDCD